MVQHVTLRRKEGGPRRGQRLQRRRATPLACEIPQEAHSGGRREALRMQVGDALNERFVLQRYIGRGAQGECWMVQDKGQEQYGLAKIYPFHQGTWDRYDLIEREARLLRQLDHPMIPKLSDLFLLEQESALCLVREWIPGRNLEQFLEEKRMSEAQVRLVARNILEALQYIHGLSPAVLHRDIKPSNIIIQPNETISLIDFGSVRDSLHTDEGLSVIGTYGYTPPEQFAGRPCPASDLYALGATLVFLLSRHHPTHLPFERNRIQFEPYVNVQPRFLKILQRLLSPNVEDRFQSARQVLLALDRCESDKTDKEKKEQDPLPTVSSTTSPTGTNISFNIPPSALLIANQNEPTRPWQQNRNDTPLWTFERNLAQPTDPTTDLSPLIETLLQRYHLDEIDEVSPPLEVVEAIDQHFGYHDESGRQWILRLLHPYDAADLLFGFYTADFVLPRYGEALMERFSLLLTHQPHNAIAQWNLLYFLHKHGWQPQELWYENQHLPFRVASHKLFGTLERVRRFLARFQTAEIGKQAKRYDQLLERYAQIQDVYELCTSVHPHHLPLFVQQGVEAFEAQALPHYPNAWQENWANANQLRRALKRLTRWPPRWMHSVLRSENRKLHRLGAYVSGIYLLYHDIDLLRIRLQQEYHWLLPPSPNKKLPTTTHKSKAL